MADPRTKRRYNLCHRLRTAGIEVDVENHAIQVTSDTAFFALRKTDQRRINSLVAEFRYVIQIRIPDAHGSVVVRSEGETSTTALRFYRKKQKPQ